VKKLLSFCRGLELGLLGPSMRKHRSAGSHCEPAVVQTKKQAYNLRVPERTVRHVKCASACACALTDPSIASMSVIIEVDWF
jgi:hypothetical protein